MATATTTEIANQAPWSKLQPFLAGKKTDGVWQPGVWNMSRQLAYQGGPEVFGGQRVAGMDPGQILGGQAMVGMSQQNPYLSGTQNYFQDVVSGQYLDPRSNPYLSQMYQSAAEDVANQFGSQLGGITQRFGMSGRTGSPGMQNAVSNAYAGLAKGLGQTAANLYGSAYEAERNRQQQMAQYLPQMFGAEQSLYTGAAQAGKLFQDYNQSLLDAQRAQFEEQQRRPYENVSWWANILNPAMGGSGQQTTRTTQQPYDEPSWWETALGIGGSLLGGLF